jgi:hypothetical protein
MHLAITIHQYIFERKAILAGTVLDLKSFYDFSWDASAVGDEVDVIYQQC